MSIIMKIVPLPKLESAKRVLFIGPHPDDIEIGCGGMVSKYKRLGAEIYYLIVTDGGSGSQDRNMTSNEIASIRKEETINASKYFNVKNVTFLGYPDGGIYNIDDVIKDISKEIQKIMPDVIFTPDPKMENEIHPDHIKTGEATSASIIVSSYFLSSLRYGIEIKEDQKLPSNITLAYYYANKPNTIIRLKKEDIDNKIKAFLEHKSQIDDSFKMLKTYIVFKARLLGLRKFSRFAEGYRVLGPTHQHCFCEVIKR